MASTTSPFRVRALWAGVALVLILPALAGGYSLLAGWPQASLILALVFAMQLFDPASRQRLPGWFHILWIGLAVLGVIWMLPGEQLLFLSPNRRAWPGPDGVVSGIAADRFATLDSLLQALGFCSVLGLGLICSDSPAVRRKLMRAMMGMVALVMGAALLIHFLRMPFILLPDVAVFTWDRLSYPFSGANLAAAFFVSCLPFTVGTATSFPEEERYLPQRRAWQVYAVVLTVALLALTVMTRNRAMWLALIPVGLLAGIFFFTRREHSKTRVQRLLLGVALLAAVGLFLTLFDPGKLIQRFVMLAGEDNSALSRLLIWENAWNTFQEYPWVGVGLGGFGEVCPTTAPAGIHQWPRYAHNEFLQFLSEAGVAGLALAVAVGIPLVMHARRLVHKHRHHLGDRLPFLAALLLLLFACGVDFPLRCPALLFLFALYWGVLFGQNADNLPVEMEIDLNPSASAQTVAVSTGPLSPAVNRRRNAAGLVLAVVLIGLTAGFTLCAMQATRRGLARAHFEAAFRQWKKDHDDIALASAAGALLENSGSQPMAASDGLNVLIGTADSPDRLIDWEAPVQSVLVQSPYHDSLYYFQALLAYLRKDFDRAADRNDLARRCAATNINTLQRIAMLDIAISADTADPVLRRTRMLHAQATARWLLTKDPNSADAIAKMFQFRQLPLSDLLPCYPVGWAETREVCQAGLDADRPLTMLLFLKDHDLYALAAANATAQDIPPPLAMASDVGLFLAVGQSAPAIEMTLKRFHDLRVDQRHRALADARQLGWGVLTSAQWDQLIAQVEEGFPTSTDRYQLGWIYFLRQQWDRAEREWRRAYNIDHSALSCQALVRLYTTLHSWPLAAEYALEWTQVAAKSPDAWRTLAQVEYMNRNYGAAQIAFDRYRALAPAQAAEDFRLNGEIRMAQSAANPPAPGLRP